MIIRKLFYTSHHFTYQTTVQFLIISVDPGTQKVMSGDSTVQEFLDEWAKAIEDSEAKYNDAMK